VLLTRELNETIRQCEIAGIRSAIDATRRVQPDVCAESIEVAGGLVAFTGIESPLSHAIGVGAFAPVTDDEITQITGFYESRGSTPRVLVTPLSHPSLGRALAAAGYAPSEYVNVLASDKLDAYALRDDRIGIAKDLKAWTRASAQAFRDRKELAPGDETIELILASSDGVWPLEAREGGAIVATAAMDIRNASAGLFGGATLFDFRRRGWHVRMIRDRVARARDAGARFARGSARPASESERNFHRCGFATLYTRVLWQRSEGERFSPRR
jgi:hypothetical protein